MKRTAKAHWNGNLKEGKGTKRPVGFFHGKLIQKGIIKAKAQALFAL